VTRTYRVAIVDRRADGLSRREQSFDAPDWASAVAFARQLCPVVDMWPSWSGDHMILATSPGDTGARLELTPTSLVEELRAVVGATDETIADYLEGSWDVDALDDADAEDFRMFLADLDSLQGLSTGGTT
jgi:hypothetical protein